MSSPCSLLVPSGKRHNGVLARHAPVLGHSIETSLRSLGETTASGVSHQIPGLDVISVREVKRSSVQWRLITATLLLSAFASHHPKQARARPELSTHMVSALLVRSETRLIFPARGPAR